MRTVNRDELVRLATEAAWADLKRQMEEDPFCGLCVVPSDGLVDGYIELGTAVAAGVDIVLSYLGVTDATE